MLKKLFCTAFFIFSCAAVQASHFDLWKNTIQVGGSVDTGNNPSTTILGKYNSELDVDYPGSPWGYSFLLTGKRATARGNETARMARSHIEGRYLFSPKTYVFAKLNYLYNTFDTYDIVVGDSAGLGRILLKDAIQRLTIEIGPGSNHQRIAGPQVWQNQFIGHGELDYLLHLSKTAEFKQGVIVDSGSLNTYFRSVSAITTTIMAHLDLQLSFAVSHYTKIPPLSTNTKKTDTSTDVTLIYKF